MKYQVTAEQVESYRKNGYVVIEGFLSTEELEDWRREVADAVQQRVSRMAPAGKLDAKHEFYSNVFLQCVRLADDHAGVARLMLDERLGEAAATLAGVDGIRIWHDQALIKQPYGNPTSWHLDNPYWSFHSKDALSIWVALDDATMPNGCMWYLPGTHAQASFENVDIGPNMVDLFKAYPQWKEIDAVACPCPAGSAVFHNGLTAHAAGPNMTSRPRRAMTCAYMPDGATFNGTQNILPKDYFESLTLGQIMNDDKQNPLIYKRATATAEV